jgi:hypothetical protein
MFEGLKSCRLIANIGSIGKHFYTAFTFTCEHKPKNRNKAGEQQNDHQSDY